MIMKCWLVKESYYLSGGGKYPLAAIKKVEGTEDYLSLAKKRNLCQTEQSMQDCLADKFHQESLKVCKCIPFSLKGFYPEVKYATVALLWRPLSESNATVGESLI